MSVYEDYKPRSLVEQKKLQWAREKEELARLCVPWGKSCSGPDKLNRRSRALSKSEQSLVEEKSATSGNLPPINRHAKVYETEGETSGYATDCFNNATPEHDDVWPSKCESEACSYRAERPRWREVHEGGARRTEPPGWLQRGLQNHSSKEVLVVCHSPGRPQSNEQADVPRTHLRGQNVPLEPDELVERDVRRQKALELQRAIKQQLEERELKRRQERERRIREEIEEEIRICREKEIERQRVENERQQLEEKREREQRRNQAMHEALEHAHTQAKSDRLRHKCPVDVEPAERAQREPPAEPRPDKSPRSGSADSKELAANYTLDSLQGVQLALLVPAMSLSSALPLTLPIRLKGEAARTRSCSTQTDAPTRRRSSFAPDKPQWGANRPPLRYLKQSEKDPQYQKRKLRQKLRLYEHHHHNCSESSDESASGARHSVWRKNERLFSQNISVYQTELVPLQVDEQGRLFVQQAPAPPAGAKERSRCRKATDSDSTDNEEMLEKLDTLRHGLLLKKTDETSATTLEHSPS